MAQETNIFIPKVTCYKNLNLRAEKMRRWKWIIQFLHPPPLTDETVVLVKVTEAVTEL